MLVSKATVSTMARTAILVLSTVLSHFVVECFIFHPNYHNRKCMPQSIHQHSSISEQNGDNEVKSGKKDRAAYTRSPDYPRCASDESMKTAKTRVSVKPNRNEGNSDRKLFQIVPPYVIESDFLVSGVRDANRRTRLLNRRSYAAGEPFEQQNVKEPPSLQDLKPPSTSYTENLWISVPFRILSFFIPYCSFPFLIRFLDNFVTMEPEQLSEITEKFGPGVSILYGTFISLTLSILYGRQRDIQDEVAKESALLALMTRNLLNIFRCNPNLCIEAGQSCADQIRILAKGSRGSELLAIMYSDPYARMLEILEGHEETLMQQNAGELGGEGIAISSCRSILQDLYKIRADRLSDESLALPPTHFLIMTILTGLIILGYAVNVLPTVDVATGSPSNESAIIFGILTTVYILFYNFAQDLNNPFSGLYQIRRSSTAAHLLQAKWLLVNNPLTRNNIGFDEPEAAEEDVLIRTPGIGDMIFARDEIYPEINDEPLEEKTVPYSYETIEDGE